MPTDRSTRRLCGLALVLITAGFAPATTLADPGRGTPDGGESVFRSADRAEHWGAADGALDGAAIVALAVDPSAPATLYAGDYSGRGMFRSDDRGATWTEIDDGLTNRRVTCITVDPSRPSTLYVGADDVPGRVPRLFRSDDRGAHWRTISDGLPAHASVSSIAVDPRRRSRVLVSLGAESGKSVYRTTDGGRTWRASAKGLARGGRPGVHALAFDPFDPSVVYAAGAGERSAAVYASVDGGRTWAERGEGLPGRGTVDVVVAASPTTLYAMTVVDGIYKSEDGGATWAFLPGAPTDVDMVALVADAGDPSTLYLATSEDGVFKSTDGGATWKPRNDGLARACVNALVADPADPTTLYAGLFPGCSGGGVPELRRR